MDKDYLLDMMVAVREKNIDINTATEEIYSLFKTETSEASLNIANVMARYKVNGIVEGKECWIFTDSKRVAEKIRLGAECNAICSVIYEWTDDGWI